MEKEKKKEIHNEREKDRFFQNWPIPLNIDTIGVIAR